jgi:GGDEF domain-containing protein
MSIDRDLNDIIALLSNCLDAYTAALFVWDEDNKLLGLRAVHSLSKHIIPKVQFSTESGGLVGWVAKNNQPLSVDHFDRDTKILPYYDSDENIKSFLAHPLQKGAGVICVDSKRQYVFTNKHQKLLSGFATVVGNTLNAGKTSRRHQMVRQLLTLWHRADALPADADDPVPYITRLLGNSCPFLRADAGLVAVPVKGGECLQPIAASGEVPQTLLKESYPIDQGIMGWIFQNRKSLVIRKFRSTGRIPFLFGPTDGLGKIGALIGMPLAWKPDEVGGVIVFIRKAKANWSKEDISGITSVVRRATLVMQNFTLRRELALVRNLDPITEVCNTNAFDRVLKKRLQRCEKAGLSLGLGIINIRGFDGLSTKVALPELAWLRQRIAAALVKHLEGRQLLGCLDSERFAVLFENETGKEINEQLAAMTDAVRREAEECMEGEPSIQADYGFALYPQDASDAHELWVKGFQALKSRTSTGMAGNEMKYAGQQK